MSMILVIIIAAVWIGILGPKLLTRGSRTVTEHGSISHFHRQLRVLEHSAPQPIVAPAYRLRAVDGSGELEPATSTSIAPVLTVVGAKELPRPALAFLGEPLASSSTPLTDWAESSDEQPRSATTPVVRESPVRTGDVLARHQIRRRRRDTLGVMVLLLVATAMIGFVPGAQAAWYLSALTAVIVVAYVAQLVHLRKVAEERERKLHYLPATPASPMVGGRYAHPAYRAAASR